MTTNREKPKALTKLLEYDVKLSKDLFVAIESCQLRDWKTYCKLLERSCNGILWLVIWLGSVWMFSNSNYYELQLNVIAALLLDIVFVAVIKAYTRRRRPTLCNDMMMPGPDKYSFPSGHSSRATFMLLIFTFIYPISMFWYLLIMVWAFGVICSRLILQRHYILDVCGGVLLGFIETLVMCLLWFDKETAASIFGFAFSDGSIEFEV